MAQYNADLATYRQTVLTAFQQVEDSLAATRVYSQQILRQQQAVKDAQDYLDLELVRYNTGVDPYVDVVIAQTTLLNSQETLNALEVNEMTSSVELVQALGGGWDRTQLPTPATSRRQNHRRGLQAAAVILIAPCDSRCSSPSRRYSAEHKSPPQIIASPLYSWRRVIKPIVPQRGHDMTAT